MGVATINQHNYLVLFNVFPIFQGLRGGNARQGMDRNEGFFLLHFRFPLVMCVSLFLCVLSIF